MGLVLQRISREPARECGTSALWKSTAAQIEAFSKTESDQPVFSDFLRLRMAAVEEQCCAPGVLARSGNTGQQQGTTGDRFSPCHWLVNRHSTVTHYQRPNMTHPQEGGTGGEVSEILFFSAKSKRRPSLIYSMQIIPVCLSIVARRKGVSATRRGGLNWTPISLLVGHPCKLFHNWLNQSNKQRPPVRPCTHEGLKNGKTYLFVRTKGFRTARFS